MNSFIEHLVAVEKTSAQKLIKLLIWIIGVVLIFFCVFASFFKLLGVFSSFLLLVAFGIGYLIYKYSVMFDYEYEYIFTNGDIDIDRITAKRSRKRILSFKVQDIEKMGLFNPDEHVSTSYDKIFYCSNFDNSYYALLRQKEFGHIMIVFQPNEKLKNAMSKYLSKVVLWDAFGRD